ncbi:YbjQ family protein [Virgisporangium aliadipatigenens]|uniref:YbjQ family protein n=1 Tax=Virgisporangium aliadipatigenens TaxID=741659 RepID=UPI001940BD3D|nr:heavy metal-binding domain-containing protein [Virgisporangium aliadipatigenens]
MLVVTTDTLPGYDIRVVLGEVLGVTASTRNPFASGLRSPRTGAKGDMAQVLVQTRARAIRQMIVAAKRRGATAVLGMRFDNRDFTSSGVEIVAYGTAVIAVPVTPEAKAHFDQLTLEVQVYEPQPI